MLDVAMNGIQRATLLLLTSATIFSATACQGGRRLQLITVTPVSADAQDYPHSQVKFTATGIFNRAPLATTPLPVKWTSGIWLNSPPSPNVVIDANGAAHCSPGFAGAASVMAFAPMDPKTPLGSMGSRTRVVSGTAQLICP